MLFPHLLTEARRRLTALQPPAKLGPERRTRGDWGRADAQDHVLAEWIGVAIMFVGIAMGYYGSIASTLGVSRAIVGLGNTVGSVQDTGGLSNALSNTSANLAAATEFRTVADIGIWTFWLGMAVFVVASRLSWNAAFRSLAQKSSGTEAGPASDAA